MKKIQANAIDYSLAKEVTTILPTDYVVTFDKATGDTKKIRADFANQYAETARKWAENPHDSAVIPNHYSALHWATEAQSESQAASQTKTDVEVIKHAIDGIRTSVTQDSQQVRTDKQEVIAAKTAVINAISAIIADGGAWTPTVRKEYPDKPSPARSTMWFISLPKGQTYTYTTGDLQNDDHNIVENSSKLYYDSITDKFYGGGDGSLAVGEIVLPNGTKRGHSITITLADLGGWSGQGGFDGDVVLGEHTLYANDGAIAIKDDDVTHQGLQVGDASAAGQQTFLHSVGLIKAVFSGVAGEFVVYTSHNLPFSDAKSVAIGLNAGKGRNDGADHFDTVTIGKDAGADGVGVNSVAIGYSAGKTGQGNYSLALGHNCGKTNQGNSSMAFGGTSAYENQGDFCIAIGEGSAFRGQGDEAIAIGLNAGYQNQPEESICLGRNSTATGVADIVIGKSTGTVKIGDGHIQSVSDKHDKTDIDYSGVHGLDFIMKLKTCTYRYDVRELYWEYNRDGSITKHLRDGSKAGKRHHPGLIAQDVKAAADELGFDFSGYRDESIAATEHHKDNADKKALVYTAFIPSLIKAIQEQQKRIEELEARLAN